MSAQTVIDSLEFARTEQELRGSLPVAGFTRLQDTLFDAAGSVAYIVRGGLDRQRRPVLALKINGLLHLRCQRCLGPLDYALDLSNTLLLVGRGEVPGPDADDPSAADYIEASPALNVAGLIEDEIMLSLPLAPLHAEGGCRSRTGAAPREAARPSPFAKLAALKKVQDDQH